MKRKTLEERIEDAWDSLTLRPVTLYLTRQGLITQDGGPGAQEIGTYSDRIDLSDFRADVYHVHAGMRR